VSATAQPDALIGTVLSDRFRLLRRLGEGGMGIVYAASTTDTGEPVAIKMLHREFLGEPQVLTRFLQEAQTYQRLKHPNILRVFDEGHTQEGVPFLVMELLEGVPLSAYTENGGKVPFAQAAAILQGMLAGLSVAHKQGIVHRDLKPDNVFLARDGGGPFVVKLLDFGIAKVMDVAGGMGKKTSTGMLLGTPAYMSPEQIKNSKDVDPRSDLFAVAVMFYEMLTGRPAFPALNEFAKLTAVLTQEAEPIAEVDPHLAFLGPFLVRAMNKDPTLRFQSAVEMATALATALGQEGPGSRAAPPLSQLPDVLPGRPSAISAMPISMPPPSALPSKPPGGTLASAGSQRAPVPGVYEAPPQVVLMPPNSGGGQRRGVAPTVVAALVVAALIAGFLLGFGAAKL